MNGRRWDPGSSNPLQELIRASLSFVYRIRAPPNSQLHQIASITESQPSSWTLSRAAGRALPVEYSSL